MPALPSLLPFSPLALAPLFSPSSHLETGELGRGALPGEEGDADDVRAEVQQEGVEPSAEADGGHDAQHEPHRALVGVLGEDAVHRGAVPELQRDGVPSREGEGEGDQLLAMGVQRGAEPESGRWGGGWQDGVRKVWQGVAKEKRWRVGDGDQRCKTEKAAAKGEVGGP